MKNYDQNKIDKLLEQHKNVVLKNLKQSCPTLEEGAYYVCSLMQDTMRMMHSVIKQDSPDEQHTKAALKIAIDTIIFDWGLSVQIHEFN